jgi:hypothetical protein
MWIDGSELPTEKHTRSPRQGRPVLASPPMPPMGRPDRVRAAVRREVVDRPPYAFWRHFPTADRSPAALAQATLRFHDRYGSDLLVVAPPAGTPPRPGAAWRRTRRRPTAVGPPLRARPEDWGTSGPSIRQGPRLRGGGGRWCGWASTAGSATPRARAAPPLDRGGGWAAAGWPRTSGSGPGSSATPSGARRDADPLRQLCLAEVWRASSTRSTSLPSPRSAPPLCRMPSPTTTPSWRRSPRSPCA